MLEASAVFLQTMKWDILENRSTTTNTESTPRWVRGKPNTKSIDNSCQMSLGMGKGVYKTMFCDQGFTIKFYVTILLHNFGLIEITTYMSRRSNHCATITNFFIIIINYQLYLIFLFPSNKKEKVNN